MTKDDRAAARRFLLRLAGLQMPLGKGRFVVGRGIDCDLVLRDEAASRRHAVLNISDETVAIQDLGSANGVYVNGERVDGRRLLAPGDVIRIGQQELHVLSSGEGNDDAKKDVDTAPRNSAPTAEHDVVAEAGTARVPAFEMVAALAEQALNGGRAFEAETLLSGHLANVLLQARAGLPIRAELREQSIAHALSLAGATNKGAWINYAVQLYALAKLPFPRDAVDALYRLVRKVPGIDRAAFRAYVKSLEGSGERFGPAELFVVRRLAGLLEVANWR